MSTPYEVQPLFAIPYFRMNLAKAITPEQVQFIKNLKMVPNQTNLISENLAIFDEPELKSLSVAVQNALDIYAKEVMGIEQKLYVTQSWSLINEPGQGMHSHSHSNSIVSGSLYYTDMPEPSAKMVFDKYTTYRRIVLDPVQEKRNIFNTPVNVLVPKTHDLLLFSSDLNHLVETNESQHRRYSIAFNTFVKGTIGDFRDVSQLSLR